MAQLDSTSRPSDQESEEKLHSLRMRFSKLPDVIPCKLHRAASFPPSAVSNLGARHASTSCSHLAVASALHSMDTGCRPANKTSGSIDHETSINHDNVLRASNHSQSKKKCSQKAKRHFLALHFPAAAAAAAAAVAQSSTRIFEAARISTPMQTNVYSQSAAFDSSNYGDHTGGDRCNDRSANSAATIDRASASQSPKAALIGSKLLADKNCTGKESYTDLNALVGISWGSSQRPRILQETHGGVQGASLQFSAATQNVHSVAVSGFSGASHPEDVERRRGPAVVGDDSTLHHRCRDVTVSWKLSDHDAGAVGPDLLSAGCHRDEGETCLDAAAPAYAQRGTDPGPLEPAANESAHDPRAVSSAVCYLNSPDEPLEDSAAVQGHSWLSYMIMAKAQEPAQEGPSLLPEPPPSRRPLPPAALSLSSHPQYAVLTQQLLGGTQAPAAASR